MNMRTQTAIFRRIQLFLSAFVVVGLTFDTANSQSFEHLKAATIVQLSKREEVALRQRLMSNWKLPAGAEDVIPIQFKVGKDRKLAGPPIVMKPVSGEKFSETRNSAVKALYKSQPFDMLSPRKDDFWLRVDFDPKSHPERAERLRQSR